MEKSEFLKQEAANRSPELIGLLMTMINEEGWHEERFIEEFRKLPRRGPNSRRRIKSRSAYKARHYYKYLKENGIT